MPVKRPVFFPPLEADTLFLRLTEGCSYNRCTFCATYRDKAFRVRPLSEIKAELKKGRERYRDAVHRVFLGDGDPLAAEPRRIREVLHALKDAFPGLDHVGMYATARNLLEKTPRTLAGLHSAGLTALYMGVESGSDEVLRSLDKGVTAEEILQAARKAADAGLQLSVLVVLGAGGRRKWREHAEATGRLLSGMDPRAVLLLTLKVIPGTPLYDAVKRGAFTPPTPVESVLELRALLSALHLTDAVFRSSHTSNYLKLSGRLPAERERLLHQLDRVLNNPTEDFFDPEYFRGS